MQVLKYFFWIGVFAFQGGSAYARTDLYGMLGLSPGVSQRTLDQSAKALLNNSTLDLQTRDRIALAHKFLSDPKLRQAYDQRKPLTVGIPPQEREEYAKLLDLVRPEEASRVRKFGEASLEHLASAATFYLAVAITTSAQCLKEKEPLYCKEYLESLKDPIGHVGFGLFILTANLTTRGLHRLVGKSGALQSMAGFAGMASGAFVSGVFSEISHMAEIEELRNLDRIIDPKQREKRKRELLKSIYDQTFGNQEWWKGQVPHISSMLAAAMAGHMTHSGLISLLTAPPPRTSRVGPPRACEWTKSTLVTVLTGQGLKGTPAFFQRRGMELLNLLTFMGYESLFHPVIGDAWNSMTVRKELRLPSLARTRSLTDEEEKKLEKTLAERMGVWAKLRYHELEKPTQIYGIHQRNLENFEKELERQYLYYRFLASGLNENSMYWDQLKSAFYRQDTKVDEIRDDLTQKMREFYTGVAPEGAIRRPKDFHGLPIPGKMGFQVKPYRITYEVDPSASKMSFEELRERFLNSDFRDRVEEAYASLQAASDPYRKELLSRYEVQVSKSLVEALSGPPSPGSDHRVRGVLPSLRVQERELRALLPKVRSESLKKRVQAMIRAVESQKASAEELRHYFSLSKSERSSYWSKKRKAQMTEGEALLEASGMKECQPTFGAEWDEGLGEEAVSSKLSEIQDLICETEEGPGWSSGYLRSFFLQ